MDDGEDSVIVVHALLAWVGLISEVNVNTTITVKEDTHLAGNGVLVQVSGDLVQREGP